MKALKVIVTLDDEGTLDVEFPPERLVDVDMVLTAAQRFTGRKLVALDVVNAVANAQQAAKVRRLVEGVIRG